MTGRGRRALLRATIAASVGLFTAETSTAQTALKYQLVATATSTSFVYVTHPPGDFSRLFALQQNGVVRIIRLPGGTLDPTPFLTVPNVVSGGETGLLGLAFHPDYATNGYLYVYHNMNSGGITSPVVRRFTRSTDNPDLADPTSVMTVLPLGGPNGIHNGGWIGFGLDGMLYITAGEGGNGSNANDLTLNLRGKVLRIDVNGDDFPDDPLRNYRIPLDNPFVAAPEDDEIWAYGLRNPWRAYLDPTDGSMWIGDTGANREEINRIPFGQGGLNFGWPCQQGQTAPGAVSSCIPFTPLTTPVADYRSPAAPPLNVVGNAVIGGEVYHGCGIPPLRGKYFFGDLSNKILSFRMLPGGIADVVEHTADLVTTGVPSVAPYGFGHDAYGELYVCRTGSIVKIVSEVPIGRDCNGNGVPDACDIASGRSVDLNGDGVPDECNPVADVDGDGATGLVDLARLLRVFGSCAGAPTYDSAADFNGDACVDLLDLAVLLTNFG